MLALTIATLLVAQCDSATCPVPPRPDSFVPLAPHVGEIEVISKRTGRPVHRASGRLVWGEKTHIGGTDLRNLGFDVPDWEINAHPLAPREVWVST